MATPLPFRLAAPGTDTIDIEGINSISYKLEGMLYLSVDGITLEWIETRTTEQVSLSGVGTDVAQAEPDYLEVPMSRLAGAWVVGGWWWPRLELRARGFQDFEQVPGVRGITLGLKIQRRDRELARDIAKEIQASVAAFSSGGIR